MAKRATGNPSSALKEYKAKRSFDKTAEPPQDSYADARSTVKQARKHCRVRRTHKQLG